jgi:hypothetical protein
MILSGSRRFCCGEVGALRTALGFVVAGMLLGAATDPSKAANHGCSFLLAPQNR